MLAIIVRRLLWLPFLLLLVALVTYGLGVYGPGDPVQVMLGLHARPDIVERIRHEYGFDLPLILNTAAAQQALSSGQGPVAAAQAMFDGQFERYLGNVLHGNFGYSLVKYQGQPVSSLLAKRLPVTIQLNLVSLAWSVPLGIVLGVIAAVRRNRLTDVLVRALVVGGISLPIILLLPFLTFVVARRHEMGMVTLGPFLPVGGWDGILSPKIIMPALLEGVGIVAVFARQTRAGMIEALGQDYVRTARAKGLTERLVVYRHALRNALIPLVTIVGFLLGGLVEGSFLVENWYGIPGLGALAFDSLLSRDYYVIMAITLLVAAAYIFANLLVDLAYAFVDPRIRYD